MLSKVAAVFTLCIFAFVAMATSNAIAHDFLLSLQPEASEAVFNQVVEALEKQGATSEACHSRDVDRALKCCAVKSKIQYPNIMMAISYEDTAAKSAGNSVYRTAEAQLEAWKSSLSSFGDSIYSLEQDQVVSLPTPVEGEPADKQ